MKLSINTVLQSYKNDRLPFSPTKSMQLYADAGFEAVDINLCAAIQPDNYLQQDNWQTVIEQSAEAAHALGIETSQCHLPFYNFAAPGQEDLEMKSAMFGRTLEAAGILGVRWAVFHPGNAPDAVLSVKESKRRTLEYLAPFADRAAALGIGIAVENLFIPEYLHNNHRYCSNVEDLIDLADTLGAGICWDFGHANLNGDNQCDCLRAIGGRLKVLHVHDNGGKHDDHAMPYSYGCNVDWAAILPVLGEIGYSGNFNLELVTGRYPEAARANHARFAADVARSMMSMTGC